MELELKINSHQDFCNPVMQQEIFDLIEGIYFIDFINKEQNETNKIEDESLYKLNLKINLSYQQDFIDVADFEIRKLNLENFDKAQVKNTIVKLEIQRRIIDRKVSDATLKNSHAYSQELQRITDLKILLEDSFQLSTISRRSLLMAKVIFVLPSLKLIKKQMKKLHLISFLKSIQAFKNFQNNIQKIDELIEKKEYPSAIAMCELNEKEMDKYTHFKCISGLKKTIKNLNIKIEESLNNNIFKMCQVYDENLYAKIISAYFSLGKVDTLFKQVNQKFTSVIYMIATQSLLNIIIRKYIENENSNSINTNSKANLSTISSYIDDLKKKEYTELFQQIAAEDYKNCLLDLCKNLWQIMKNYYRMCICNYNNFINSIDSQINTDAQKDAFKDIQKKVPFNLNQIWIEIQQKISLFFCSMKFENYKFDEFIEILTIVNRFIEIGQEFCNKNADSKILIKAVKDQTLAYFFSYHMSHLEELKMFLENEQWQLCPVKRSFSIYKLQEYKFLSSSKTSFDTTIEFKDYNSSNESIGIERDELCSEINSTMVELLKIENPFYLESKLKQTRSNNNHNQSDDISYDNHDNDEEEEEEIEFDEIDYDYSETSSIKSKITNKINTEEDESNTNLPIITNTTLNIIRLFGKYIHMLSIFKIISAEVISYLMQLFYFYLYYIYLHFAHEESDNAKNQNSLQVTINNIKKDLFSHSNNSFTEPKIESVKILRNRQDYLDCLNQRIVACESLIFLSNQLENLFPLIIKFLPENSNNLDKYQTILSETHKIKTPIYLYILRFAIDYSQISETIGRSNWDIDEILSQHNQYVEVILKQIKQLIADVESLHLLASLKLKTLNTLLEQCIKLIMRMLVDGYSSVKKCSNEGRALMQLDFQQLVVKLEKICNIRPIPDKEYVEAYIKAFYLPDTSIEKWIRDHPEYSQKNLISLVNIMAQVTRKTRTNVMAYFESSS